jgi:hypothetical protein
MSRPYLINKNDFLWDYPAELKRFRTILSRELVPGDQLPCYVGDEHPQLDRAEIRLLFVTGVAPQVNWSEGSSAHPGEIITFQGVVDGQFYSWTDRVAGVQMLVLKEDS